MVMSEYTPKTYTAMHYTRFIRPGARRIDAEPGFAAVQVGAFLHEKDGDTHHRGSQLYRSGADAESGSSAISRDSASLKAYRTSATENLKEVGEVAVRDDKASFQMTPQSIVTFTGKM